LATRSKSRGVVAFAGGLRRLGLVEAFSSAAIFVITCAATAVTVRAARTAATARSTRCTAKKRRRNKVSMEVRKEQSSGDRDEKDAPALRQARREPGGPFPKRGATTRRCIVKS